MSAAPVPTNPPPEEAPSPVERRLTELEIKASFADDLVDDLNRIVARQQAQLDLLAREIAWLKRRSASPRDPADPDDPAR